MWHLLSGAALGASLAGPPLAYVILTGPIPVQYSFEDSLPGSYIGLYRRDTDEQVATQTVQRGVNRGGQLAASTCASRTVISGFLCPFLAMFKSYHNVRA